MHLSEIGSRNIQAKKDEALLQNLHNQQFSDWLRNVVMISCSCHFNYLKLIEQDYYDL